MKKANLLFIAGVAGLFGGIPLSASAQSHADHAQKAEKVEQAVSAVETRLAMRDLWVGHIFWVRNVSEALLNGNKAEAAAAEKEVVANAKQIAGAIEPFYGKPASEKLFGLLAGHYGAVKQYAEATAANSKAKQETAQNALVANADEIAKFLSSANPNLPYGTVRGLMIAHGGHHIQQIQQFKAKQYAEEAQTWNAMKNHIYVISDALTGAIAKQFPEKFK
jgi:hypothetical protein